MQEGMAAYQEDGRSANAKEPVVKATERTRWTFDMWLISSFISDVVGDKIMVRLKIEIGVFLGFSTVRPDAKKGNSSFRLSFKHN